MFARQDLKAAALAYGAFLLALAGAAPVGAAYQCPGTTTPLKDAVCQDPNTARTSIAQAPGSGNPIDLADERIVVPLDNTGIQSWSFLNPRNPFPLVRPAQPAGASALASSQACIQEALRCTRIEFHNQTLDREFDVILKFTLTVPEIGNLGLLAKVADLERRVRGRADGYLRDLAAAMADSPDTGSARELELTAMTRSCRNALDGLGTPDGLKLVANALQGKTDKKEYLGPCTRFAENLQQNRIADISEEVDRFATEIWKLNILLQLSNPENICKHGRNPRILDCSFRHGVPANTPTALPAGIIGLLPVNETVEFTVSLQQEEDAVLTNKTGYLATGPTGREPDNRTSWTASTAVGYDYKPTKNEVTRKDGTKELLPYGGERTSTSSAVGRLGFAAFLGDRARGEVSLAYKKGVLGDGTDGTAKAELYTFNIFAKSGLTLRMGKYEIAAPASGIAISETGEGGELIKPGRRGSSYSLGYLARRESADDKGNADPKGNDKDLDSDLYIFQAKGLSFGNGFFRSGSVVALWGEDENDASKIATDTRPLFLKQPHKYWTAGGELQFAIPDSSFSGSLAHFWSHLDREGKPENPEPDGDGMATLLTFGWAQVDDAKERTLRKFTIVAGMGSGNDPKTPENDGYLGENASGFTGNTFLLTHIAGNIPNVDKGMVNKTFAGFEITDNEKWARFSPLRGIVNLLDTQDQIIDESLILRIYGFRFNEPLFDKREASLEATTEFSIQVPKGVRTTLKVGYLVPGPALKTLVGKDPWFVSTQVKLDIK